MAKRGKLNFWKGTKLFSRVLSQLGLFILSVCSTQFQEHYSEVIEVICLVSNMTKGFYTAQVEQDEGACEFVRSAEIKGVRTSKMVKFSRTLFIMYFSGKCFSLWMKLIIYSHIGERFILYTNRPFSNLAYSV